MCGAGSRIGKMPITEIPEPEARSSRRPDCARNSGANSPSTVGNCTPTFSKPAAVHHAMTAGRPPLGRMVGALHGGARAARAARPRAPGGQRRLPSRTHAQMSSRSRSNHARARIGGRRIMAALHSGASAASASRRVREIARLRAREVDPAESVKQAFAEAAARWRTPSTQRMRIRTALSIVILRNLFTHAGVRARPHVDIAEALGVEQRLGGTGPLTGRRSRTHRRHASGVAARRRSPRDRRPDSSGL